MLKGDILVTAVGEHYAIGRLKADRDTQEHLGWQLDRTEAVKQACGLAGAGHRVFLYASAGTSDYLPFDCAEVFKPPKTGGKRSRERPRHSNATKPH
jgi:hypothetical protein